ncbi:hypothetical protein Sjap_019934 [Stephania japonica]|uniref:Endonuclease/exonuclease/phosphatase domain-containing protein n=1 Tax=Stephania japonica TaxID=461633 RepID=A0AAP0F2E9_9MAGN
MGSVAWAPLRLPRLRNVEGSSSSCWHFHKKDEDMRVNGVILNNYKRVRMEIDVEKPLLRGYAILLWRESQRSSIMIRSSILLWRKTNYGFRPSSFIGESSRCLPGYQDAESFKESEKAVGIRFCTCNQSKGYEGPDNFLESIINGAEKADQLGKLSNKINRSGESCIVLGDFNAIVSQREKIGGLPWEQDTNGELISFIVDIQAIDLGFKGPKIHLDKSASRR